MARKPAERTYAPAETRKALLKAALDLFAERGFTDTSTQDLADRARVTKGAFYYHFRTKEQILHIIHDEFIDRALELQRLTLERYESPTDQLGHMAYDLTIAMTQFQKHVTVFFREQHILKGRTRAAILEKRHRSTEIYQETVRRGVESGEFSAELDPDVAALGLLGMCVWTYQWFRPRTCVPAKQVARQYATMALQSVGAKCTVVDL